MTKRLKNILAIALIYTGVIIGAGFASGQEIVYFFVRFGTMGIVGFMLACLLFCLIGGVVLYRAYINGLHPTFFRKSNKPWATKGLFNVFLLFSYAIMLAGMATILSEISNINYAASVVIVALMTSLSLAFRIEGIVTISNYVVPFLLLGLTLLCGRIISLESEAALPAIRHHAGWLFHAVLYVGYNSIAAVMFLPSLGYLIHNKNDAIISAVLGGTFIFLPGFLMITALLRHGTHPTNTELPLISLTDRLGSGYTTVYLIILAIAMYTTAIAALYSIITWLHQTFKIPYKFQLTILPLLAIPLATTGFSKLVKAIYPFFGYIGVAYLIYMLISHFKTAMQKYN
ncbi:MAG TPA: hypothetical protein GXZ32_04515 [Clostridiales bacterium]|nr:hypothetical protein [Clostridiales bacterium]